MAACSCGGHDVQLPGSLKVTPHMMRPASTFLPMRMLSSRFAPGPPAAKWRPLSASTSAYRTNCTGCDFSTGAEISDRSQPAAAGVMTTVLCRGTYSASNGTIAYVRDPTVSVALPFMQTKPVSCVSVAIVIGASPASRMMRP